MSARLVAIAMMAFGCLSLAIVANGQPSSTGSISLQAKLDGVIGGTVDLTVQFYDAASGGNPVGAPIALMAVPVQSGIVSVPVPVDATVFNGATRYMGISVNGGAELVPRTLVTSVPYAMQATTLPSPGLVQGDSPTILTVQSDRPSGTGRATALVATIASSDTISAAIRGAAEAETGMTFGVWGQNGSTDAYSAGVIGSSYGATGASAGVFGQCGSPQGYGGLFENGGGGYVLAAIGPGFTHLMSVHSNGTTTVKVLTITGGSDVAEPVAISPTPDLPPAAPGMVMVIDRNQDGRLVPCSAPYDKAVAGVLSGANGLKPGMVLSAEGQRHTAAGDDTMPLAMAGRVWVLCDAAHGPISRGDSLTTSPTPGHAMVVSDESRRAGAVIGKAMTEMKDGKGMVLVLVNLQ